MNPLIAEALILGSLIGGVWLIAMLIHRHTTKRATPSTGRLLRGFAIMVAGITAWGLFMVWVEDSTADAAGPSCDAVTSTGPLTAEPRTYGRPSCQLEDPCPPSSAEDGVRKFKAGAYKNSAGVKYPKKVRRLVYRYVKNHPNSVPASSARGDGCTWDCWLHDLANNAACLMPNFGASPGAKVVCARGQEAVGDAIADTNKFVVKCAGSVVIGFVADKGERGKPVVTIGKATARCMWNQLMSWW